MWGKRSTAQPVTLLLLLGFIALTSLSVVWAAPPVINNWGKPAPAGTEITNRAEIIYFDTLDGMVKKLYSNVAVITVGIKPDFHLEHDNHLQGTAGQVVNFPHRLTNTGNIASDYQLTYENSVTDSGDLTDITLFHDENGNGIPNAGESTFPAVSCSTPSATTLCYDLPELESGDVIEFVFQAKLSGTVQEDDVIAQTLTASSSVQPDNQKTNQDDVTVTAGANLVLSKDATPACGVPISPEASVKFRINFTNVGTDKPNAREFIIDGALQQGAMLEDYLPNNLNVYKNVANPTFAPIQGQLVVQLRNEDDTNNWLSYDAWNGTDVISRIGLYLSIDHLSSNQSGFLEFTTLASAQLTSAVVYNQAHFNTSGVGTPEFNSNITCTNLEPETEGKNPNSRNDARIRFMEPILGIKYSNNPLDFHNDTHFQDTTVYYMDNAQGYDVTKHGVFMQLHSSGFNKEESKVDQAVIKLTSPTGDTLLVTMIETGANTGIFRSIAPIRLSQTDRGNNRQCPLTSTTPDLSQGQTECVLQNTIDGRITAETFDPGIGLIITDAALVDPQGIVFDTSNTNPIPGAIVTVHNVDGSIATNPVNGQPYNPVTTGNDGRFQFPVLYTQDGTHVGQYYLSVVPPGSYSSPSKMPASNFHTYTVNDYSYGKDGFNGVINSGVFTLLPDSPILYVDIPLDPPSANMLVLDKTVDTPEVGIGDYVKYSIKIQNNTGDKLYNVVLHDLLPYGFRYVRGTAHFDDKKIVDPLGGSGPELTFRITRDNIKTIPNLDTETHTLSYLLRATAGSRHSDGINRAQASAYTDTSFPVKSNETRAQVEITQDGVLLDRGIIFGKIYVDKDCSHTQNNAEFPIGGVKLYMEDGSWVITDENGQYSLYGVKPGNHALKIDPLTLPEGLELKPIDTRHMADPDSRWVDLVAGEMHKANFAAMCPTSRRDEIMESIRNRNAAINGDWKLEEASRYDSDSSAQRDSSRKTGADGDLSNGYEHEKASAGNAKLQGPHKPLLGYALQLMDTTQKDKAETHLDNLPASVKQQSYLYKDGDIHSVRMGFSTDKQTLKTQKATLKSQFGFESGVVRGVYERLPQHIAGAYGETVNLIGMADPQAAIKTVTNAQGKAGTWLWPQSNISTDGRLMFVTRSGIVPTLKVNGEFIPKDNIGTQIENRREKAQVIAWYGVPMKEGENHITITAKGPFGNARTLAEKTFIRPANGVKVEMTPLEDQLTADGGRSVLPIRLRILDDNGNVSRNVHYATLTASEGQWLQPDIQDKEAGHQVRISNGERIIHLRSSEYTGTIKIGVSVENMQDETQVAQVAPLRPLIAIGLIDIGAHFYNFDGNGLNPSGLDSLGKDSELKARGALFVKGKVWKDKHLTLSYDTDKDKDDELFRDINPDDYYPVYGDASVRGYEAQSRSKLYAKLEKGKDSIMWGDYLTDSHSTHENLARTQRSLTGINGIMDNGTTRVQVFASQVEEGHITEVIPGNGTAMNYRIKHYPIIRGSETVEIVTTDRDNPGLVIERRTLTRFGEYTLDDIVGYLSFGEVVPTYDNLNNPVHLHISYDTKAGDNEKYEVGGVRLTQKITEELSGDLSYTQDNHETEGYKIAGAALKYDDGKTTINSSLAKMEHEDSSKKSGMAARVTVEHEWRKGSRTTVDIGSAEAGFTNSASGVAAGRKEAKIRHTEQINDTINLNGEITHSESLAADEIQQTASLTVDAKVAEDLIVRGGARHIRQKNSGDNDRFNTVIVGAEKRFEVADRNGKVSAEYEQDMGDSGRKRAQIGAEIEVAENTSLYAQFERINSLSGVGGLSNEAERDTVSVGVKSKLNKNTEVFSEYRVRGAIDSREAEMANGIRSTFEIEPGFSIAPSLEIVRVLEGTSANDSAALSIGLKDTRNPNARNLLRFDVRHSEASNFFGIKAAHVSRINEDWSGIARSELRFERPDAGADNVDHTLTIGVAKRPRKDDKHNMVFMYQNKEKRGGGIGDDRSTHILSTHQNYEVDKDISLSGRLGAKVQTTDIGGTDYKSDAAIADGRVIWDVDRRWSVNAHGGLLGTNSMKETAYSAGVGASYLVRENMTVGVDYNVKGFEDEDLDNEGFNEEGARVMMQYKFDESSLYNLMGELDEMGNGDDESEADADAQNNASADNE